MYNTGSKHLLNVASLYSNNNSISNTTVECHLMYQYLLSSGEVINNLEIYNKENFLKICRWCMVTWKSGMSSVYIEPEKRKRKSLRYLCNKNPHDLNKYQRKLVKKCMKYANSNSLVVSCHMCHKKSKMHLQKPKAPTRSCHIGNDSKKSENFMLKGSKKKNKKKDLCAGLNPAVLAKFHGRIHENNSGGKSACIMNRNGEPSGLSISKKHSPENQFKSNRQFINKDFLNKRKTVTAKLNVSSRTKKKKSLVSSFLDSL